MPGYDEKSDVWKVPDVLTYIMTDPGDAMVEITT